MKAFFDRDGRKTITVNVPQTEDGKCKMNSMEICVLPKCRECETKKLSLEFRSVQFLVPLHEQTIDTGSYARWSEFMLMPKDRMPEMQGESYVMPEAMRQALKTAIAMMSDLFADEKPKESGEKDEDVKTERQGKDSPR